MIFSSLNISSIIGDVFIRMYSWFADVRGQLSVWPRIHVAGTHALKLYIRTRISTLAINMCLSQEP